MSVSRLQPRGVHERACGAALRPTSRDLLSQLAR